MKAENDGLALLFLFSYPFDWVRVSKFGFKFVASKVEKKVAN